MPRRHHATQRTNLYLTAEAASLLGRLAPSARRHGAYVSALIVDAAQKAGHLPGLAAPGRPVNLAALQADLQVAQHALDTVQQRLTAALGQPPPAPVDAPTQDRLWPGDG